MPVDFNPKYRRMWMVSRSTRKLIPYQIHEHLAGFLQQKNISNWTQEAQNKYAKKLKDMKEIPETMRLEEDNQFDEIDDEGVIFTNEMPESDSEDSIDIDDI